MDWDSGIPHGKLLLITQLEVITPTTIAGTLYGISFAIFCLYIHSMVPRLQNNGCQRRATFMLGYSAIIMICGLYILVSNAWITQDAFVKHGDYPGGPWAYVESTLNTQPVIATSLSCQFGIDTLTSIIQVWRVWKVWGAAGYASLAVVLPSLCFLTFTALRLRTLIFETTTNYAEVLRVDKKIQIAEIAIQATTTVLCTILISSYLIYCHRRQRNLMGLTGEAHGAIKYIKIVAMLIESYTLESIWLLTVAIIWNHAVSTFFFESRVYVEIIAYLLVQYRVARGEAYESQGEQSYISSLQWDHSNRAMTQVGRMSESSGDRYVLGASVTPTSSAA